MLQRVVDYYHNIKVSGDARSNQLPFVADPLWSIGAAVIYLVIVIYGPQLMDKRKGFHLRNLLIGYNLFSVVLSLWMMWEFFFILRKKNNQISFLHVYHHASMLLLQWALVKWVPGGASYFGPMCNCFIHAVMYTYYMLAAMGPHMQKYLWWKRYLTRMQMIQFVAIFLYCSNAISTHPPRETMKTLFWVHWLYMITLFWLFNHFYQTSYTAKTKDKDRCGSEADTKKDD